MGRVLGVDVGGRRIGLAVSDPLGWTAQPYRTLERGREEAATLAELREICRRLGVERIVVGLPRTLRGEIGPQARAVEAFARALAGATGLPVEFEDERLTTVEAERAMLEADLSRRRRKRAVDRTAAALILQAYLERRRRQAGGKARGEEEAPGGGESAGEPLD
ncbi:MAG: Holliday junction resolvase RuvX [Bacillota bacterium]|nr:Holliday junction resolvase RuvX [Bacillota bacterium]